MARTRRLLFPLVQLAQHRHSKVQGSSRALPCFGFDSLTPFSANFPTLFWFPFLFIILNAYLLLCIFLGRFLSNSVELGCVSCFPVVVLCRFDMYGVAGRGDNVIRLSPVNRIKLMHLLF